MTNKTAAEKSEASVDYEITGRVSVIISAANYGEVLLFQMENTPQTVRNFQIDESTPDGKRSGRLIEHAAFSLSKVRIQAERGLEIPDTATPPDASKSQWDYIVKTVFFYT